MSIACLIDKYRLEIDMLEDSYWNADIDNKCYYLGQLHKLQQIVKELKTLRRRS